jgi:hypothetical protein
MYKRRSLVSILLALCMLAWTSSSEAIYLRRQSQLLTSAPPLGKANDGTVRFVALGDTGTGGAGQLAIAHGMANFHDKHPFATVLLLGDNVYPDGNPAGLRARFERPYADLLRRGVRFRAVLGNHDVKRGRAAQINYESFNMGGRPFYSFVEGEGLVEFFGLDSTRMNPPQLEWLEGALAASKAVWKIAYFHHPIYSSARAHGSNPGLRALLEPIFVRHGVAATFSGHDHVYQRIKLQSGIQHFVAGAGAKLRRGDTDRLSPLHAAGNDQVTSFVYVEATRDRLSFWAVDAAGRILDSGVLALVFASGAVG